MAKHCYKFTTFAGHRIYFLQNLFNPIQNQMEKYYWLFVEATRVMMTSRLAYKMMSSLHHTISNVASKHLIQSEFRVTVGKDCLFTKSKGNIPEFCR